MVKVRITKDSNKLMEEVLPTRISADKILMPKAIKTHL
jgi:hypothetical protein